MKKPVYLVLPLLLFCHALIAEPLSAEDAVRKTTDEVLRWLNMDRDELRKDPEYLEILVQELIVPHFDMDTMSELVLGEHWEKINERQQACFTNSFRNMLVERYARVLLSYNNQSITYEPAKPIGEKDYVSVRQTITRDGAKPLPIEYPMHPDGKGWKVVDIIIDGISLIKSYRNSFNDEIHMLGLEGFLRTYPECFLLEFSETNTQAISSGSLMYARI
jgi:phospholipid transport system substrate-binding protein